MARLWVKRTWTPFQNWSATGLPAAACARTDPCQGWGLAPVSLGSPHFTKGLRQTFLLFRWFIFLGFDTHRLRYLQIQVLVTVLFVSLPWPSFLGLAFWWLFLAYLGSFHVRVCFMVCSGCRAVCTDCRQALPALGGAGGPPTRNVQGSKSLC